MEMIQNSNRKVSGRERWKTYRELAEPKWGRAFKKKIQNITGQPSFEYWLACARFNDPQNERIWTENLYFQNNLTPFIRIISLETIFRETVKLTGTTPANSELGRLIQLLKVAVPNFQ
jgi:hypothetical protein